MKLSIVLFVSLFLQFSCNNESKPRAVNNVKVEQQKIQEKPVNATEIVEDNPSVLFFSTPLSVKEKTAFCLPIKVKNFKQILGFQMSVKWNESILTYESFKSSELPFYSQNSFNFNEVKSGEIGTIWFDPSVKGIDLKDGASIGELCFNAIKKGKTDLTIFDNPVKSKCVSTEKKILKMDMNIEVVVK